MRCPNCNHQIETQRTLFDEGPNSEGEQLRDQSMGRVESGASEEWKGAALHAVHLAAIHNHEITVDDATALMDPTITTKDDRAWGPMMVRGSKEGWIFPTERFVKSGRASSHAGPRRVWRSLV